MAVIRSFPFGCTTDHVDAVISTSSYREAGNCGVVWRWADSFGPPDGVGARSDISGRSGGGRGRRGPGALLRRGAAQMRKDLPADPGIMQRRDQPAGSKISTTTDGPFTW